MLLNGSFVFVHWHWIRLGHGHWHLLVDLDDLGHVHRDMLDHVDRVGNVLGHLHGVGDGNLNGNRLCDPDLLGRQLVLSHKRPQVLVLRSTVVVF